MLGIYAIERVDGNSGSVIAAEGYLLASGGDGTLS